MTREETEVPGVDFALVPDVRLKAWEQTACACRPEVSLAVQQATQHIRRLQAYVRRASTGGERERLKELEDTLSEIARGDVPSPSFGHYLAHRHAVKLARRALSASSGKEGGNG